jgi:cytochrome c peroxidase
LADGNLIIALAGLGQITAGPSARPDTWGLEVGGRPTVIALAPDGRRAFVACSFDDSIAILDHREGRLVARVPLGPPRRIDDIERGERLFHDARLSHEGWMSCHGCHSEGHTSGRLADTFGDRSYGTPKRTPSLLGIAGTAPFGWDGGVSSLEEQIVRSIRTTMRGPEPSTDQVRDLAAYLRSLPPPPSAASLTSRHTAEAIERGRSVFLRERCDRCHEPPGFTSTRVFHVGLTDELGMSRFNPPSLRGLSQRGALLHDGRARDATDVLTRQGHPSRIELSGPELADLLSFLDSL